MAKLTESYLRNMIKQAINEMYIDDDALSVGEEESYDLTTAAMKALGLANELDYFASHGEGDITTADISSLAEEAHEIYETLSKYGDQAVMKSHSMAKTARHTGMPSADSEFGTVRSMDESRRRKLAPKRR